MITITLHSAHVLVADRNGKRFQFRIQVTLGIKGVPNCVHRSRCSAFKYHSARSALEAGSKLLPHVVEQFTLTVHGAKR